MCQREDWEIFVVVGGLGFIFALVVGVYVLKNARELSESTHRASGEAFGTGLWLSTYRVTGILAIG
jgi:hypothetical protein